MAASLDELTLFDRINLAYCAMRRAEQHVCNEQRFLGEFQTTRLWNKYRCIISNKYQYVERD